MDFDIKIDNNNPNPNLWYSPNSNPKSNPNSNPNSNYE
jgi:hypothetical protein